VETLKIRGACLWMLNFSIFLSPTFSTLCPDASVLSPKSNGHYFSLNHFCMLLKKSWKLTCRFWVMYIFTILSTVCCPINFNKGLFFFRVKLISF